MRGLLGCTAIAVLMMMSFGTHPAKAHVSYCDLAPENCYRAGDGHRYHLSPGSPLEKAYKAGKVGLPYLVERRRKQRDCALHAANGYFSVDPAPPKTGR
jgi:hypothetical protein